MSRINEATINEILKNTDIVDVIREVLPLQKKGKNYICTCPFHDDHSPSLTVSKEKQIFKCFACGESGNAISFIQKYYHLSFPQAVKIAAQRINISVEDPYEHNQKINEETKRVYKMNETFAEYTNYLLSMDQSGKKYLKERDIKIQTANEMKIGMFHETEKMKNYMIAKGFKEEELVKYDLINLNGNSKWKDRLLFPIKDASGNIHGFGGRRINEGADAKYLNTAESEIFKKDRLFFNLDQAMPEIRKEKRILLTEGYIDVIQASQHQLKNVVACLGTSLTKNHISYLSKLHTQVVLIYDGDNPGINAAVKNSKLLLQSGICPNVVLLPDGKDLDDVCKENVQIIYDQMNQNYLDFRLQTFNDQGFQKNKEFCLDYIKDLILYKDPITEDHYLKKLAEVSKFSFDSLKEQCIALKPNQKIDYKPNFSTRAKSKVVMENRKRGKVFINFKHKKTLNYREEIQNLFDSKKEKVTAFQKEKICDKKDILLKYQEHQGAVLETQITLVGYENVEAHAIQIAEDICKQLSNELKIDTDNLTYLGYLHMDTKNPHLHLQFWQKIPFLSEYKINTSLINEIERAIHHEMANEVVETQTLKIGVTG